MKILPQEIIAKKRNNKALSSEEVEFFVQGLVNNQFNDAQVGAMAMAIFLNKMSIEEKVALTLSMKNSGEVLNWKSIVDGPIVDKHSTGGVGDKVSLMLAPMVAACGAYVPMITGRGLGHTGGTVDKMESIPGYNLYPSKEKFNHVVKRLGTAIVGQSDELAPADKRLYAIRDITATVESIELITASILSKKLAAGLATLVLDVKVGSGAMMKNVEDATLLARSLVDVANGAGVKTKALLTDMNQVLGYTAGNAVEISEVIDYLTTTKREPRLHALVMAQAEQMLLSSGLASTTMEANQKVTQGLESGKAAEIFEKMVFELGGPSDILSNSSNYLTKAKFTKPILAPTDGYINTVDTRAVGMTIVAMGGGRTNHTDDVNHALGITNIIPLGTKVTKGEPMAMLHIDDESKAEGFINLYLNAHEFSEEKPKQEKLIYGIVEAF